MSLDSFYFKKTLITLSFYTAVHATLHTLKWHLTKTLTLIRHHYAFLILTQIGIFLNTNFLPPIYWKKTRLLIGEMHIYIRNDISRVYKMWSFIYLYCLCILNQFHLLSFFVLMVMGCPSPSVMPHGASRGQQRTLFWIVVCEKRNQRLSFHCQIQRNAMHVTISDN